MQSIKRYTIFAGVNGAGKSTLFEVDSGEDLGVRLNSDEIIKESGRDWRDDNAQVDAGRTVLTLQKKCFEDGLSLNQETTLCGNSIIKAIKHANELNYRIYLRYVGVKNADIAKNRVEMRIKMGGHGVSGGTIERRFESSKNNFLKVCFLCDNINIYDNSGDSLILCAYTVKGKFERTNVCVQWVEELLKEIENKVKE